MSNGFYRTFRAKLVAQEHIDQCASSNSAQRNSKDEKQQQQQQQLSKFLTGAISSFFKQNDNERHGSNESSSTKLVKEESNTSIDVDKNKIEESMMMFDCINDPFADEKELPALIGDSYQDSFDHHRWAHQLHHVEPGCVLIANEKLGGVFHQTVLLIIEHNDQEGSLGIVINRPLPGTLVDISGSSDNHLDAGLRTAFNGAKVSYGGPVMQDEYSVLHGWGQVDGSKKVAPGVFVGGSSELAFEARRNNFDPSQALFIKGHAAWVPNQLNREIMRGVWYMASVSPDLILRYAGAPQSEQDNLDDLWADILTALGGNFSKIAKAYSGPGDRRMKQP